MTAREAIRFRREFRRFIADDAFWDSLPDGQRRERWKFALLASRHHWIEMLGNKIHAMPAASRGRSGSWIDTIKEFFAEHWDDILRILITIVPLILSENPQEHWQE